MKTLSMVWLAALLCPGSLMANDLLADWAERSVSEGHSLSISIATRLDGANEFITYGKTEPNGRPIDKDTRYEIGSITKAFTNLLLAEMVAANKVSYSTTLADVLGDRIDPTNPAVAEITLLELATHSSGLPRLPGNLSASNPDDPYAGYDESLLIEGVNAARRQQALVKQYAYSNFGAGLLGFCLGLADGTDYAQALQKYVLDPAELNQTSLTIRTGDAQGFRSGNTVSFWTSLDSLAGAGGLRASTSQLLTFAEAMTEPRVWPLSYPRADTLTVLAKAGDFFDVTPVWHVASAATGKNIFWHNGGTGGFWSFLGFRADTGSIVVILVAGDDNPTDIGLEWLGSIDDQAQPAEPDRSIIGQYQFNAAVGLSVYEEQSRVYARLSGQPSIDLDLKDGDWYAISSVDASLHFVREGTEVVAVELAQNGIVQRAERTSDQPQRIERPVVALSSEQLDAFVGVYTINEQVKFTIRRADDGLEAKLTGQQFYPIFAAGDDVFFYKVVEAELHFERNDDGGITALTLHQGPVVQRAERTE